MAIKAALNSLGCAKNLVDAERLLATLHQGGIEITADVADADVMIVNTCGFILSAKEEGIETILEYVSLKQEGRLKGIVVTGCLAQRYFEEMRQSIPEIDCILTPGTNDRICEAVIAAAEGRGFDAFEQPEKLKLTGDRVVSTPDGFAYLKIADGCDNRCTYCKIPDIRGAFRSVPMEELVSEAADLAAQGVKELVVIAQDTTRYGVDLYGHPALVELLKKLAAVEGIEWIRIMYLYPDKITDELLDYMASEPKMVRYIEMPIQHSDAKVLAAMNRRGDEASLLALVERIRTKLPGAVLRTTLMVGFPGEDKATFQRMTEFVKKARFDRLGCFVFSPEEDTPAAAMTAPRASAKTAERRQEIIMLEQSVIMEQKARERIGKTVRVLVEGFDRYAEYWFGRSTAEAPEVDPKIFFKAKGIAAGQMVDVRLTDVIDYDMIGELCNG